VCGLAKMADPNPHPAADAACGVGLELETGGVGAAVVVAGCVAGSPAHRSRSIRAGDVLAAVDGVSIAGFALWRIREAICGRPDTTVRLSFRRRQRGPGQDIFHVVLARQPPQWDMDASAWSAEAAGPADSALHEADLDGAALDQEHFDSTIWAARGQSPSRQSHANAWRWSAHEGVGAARLSKMSHVATRAVSNASTTGLGESDQYYTGPSRPESSWFADGAKSSRPAACGDREVGGWEWVSRYAIGAEEPRLQDDESDDPFLPSLSASPELRNPYDATPRHGSVARRRVGRGEEVSPRRDGSFRHERSPAARPPLPTLQSQGPGQRVQGQHPPTHEQTNTTKADRRTNGHLLVEEPNGPRRMHLDNSESDLRSDDEELHARVAVLGSENRRLKQRVDELEAFHRTVEEAEDMARQAKQANREMDERLLGQLERIEELKKELGQVCLLSVRHGACFRIARIYCLLEFVRCAIVRMAHCIYDSTFYFPGARA